MFGLRFDFGLAFDLRSPLSLMLVRLLELIRFSHTLFALPFALLAAAMAWSANLRAEPPVPFRWLDLLGILVCMVFARSAAMAFNRLADRRLDALNPRTQTRHLPTGLLSTGSVVAVHGGLFAGFRGRHALVPAAQSDPALRRRCRCWCFCSATAMPSGSRCCRISGWARR